MTTKTNPEVGYTILRTGAGQTSEVCLVVPHVQVPVSLRLDVLTRRMELEGSVAGVATPDMPTDVVATITSEASRVLLVTTDCMARVNSAATALDLSSSKPPGDNPEAMFNGFLNRCVRNAHLQVEHRRVLARQPESESFARKAVAVLTQHAPATKVEIQVHELRTRENKSGPAGLGSAANQVFESTDWLRRYTLNSVLDAAAEPAPTNPARAPFALLHAYAFHQASQRFGLGSRFLTAAASVGAGVSGSEDALSELARKGMDSVFVQSLCDVEAISLCATFDSNVDALAMLAEVQSHREAAGDFGAFSLMPLSTDTSAALEILKAVLALPKDFSVIASSERFAHSCWIASESVKAWLMAQGVLPKTATAVSVALEATAAMLQQNK